MIKSVTLCIKNKKLYQINNLDKVFYYRNKEFTSELKLKQYIFNF